MADVTIERTELAVTFTVAAYKDLPAYRDTLHVTPTSTRAEQIALAKERYAAWAAAIRNPPAPEPVEVPSRDEALSQAREALQQAMDAVDAVQESTSDVEV